MRKGEVRREKILDAAEALFWDKGYESTSVQDILDAVPLSKGGFYHYFDSKEAVLAEVCKARCAVSCGAAGREILLSRAGACERLNRALALANVFQREDPRLAAMMTRVAAINRDVNLREVIRASVTDCLAPVLTQVLEDGVREDVFSVRRPEQMAKILLLLAHDGCEEVMRIIAASPDDPECLIRAMECLDAVRDGVERLLSAPYGSVRILEMDRMVESLRLAEEASRKS